MKSSFFIRFGLIALVAFGFQRIFADNFDATTEIVGRGTNGFVTPVNQFVTPAGVQVELPGIRPNALALSPDGKLLVTAGLTHELVVVEPATGKISQHVPLPSDKAQEQTVVSPEILSPDGKAQLSFTGLAFSPDGSRIYMANVNGDIKVFGVGRDQKVLPLFSIALPPANAPRRTNDIPADPAAFVETKENFTCQLLPQTKHPPASQRRFCSETIFFATNDVFTET
jgi:DNA-binding beta-propeller fold protein YncE